MPLSIIFQLLVYRDGQFYWLRKPEYSEKTIDLPQVTENFITKHTSQCSGLILTTLVVLGYKTVQYMQCKTSILLCMYKT